MISPCAILLSQIIWLLLAEAGLTFTKPLFSVSTESQDELDKKISSSKPFEEATQWPLGYLMLPSSTQKSESCKDIDLELKRRKRTISSVKKSESEGSVRGQLSNASTQTQGTDTQANYRYGKNVKYITKRLRENKSQKQGGSKKNASVPSADDNPDQLAKVSAVFAKKGRKKKLLRKNQNQTLRQKQTAKRLRQHMQHKKKVKQFLQKRVQEQIQLRSMDRKTEA